MFLTVVIDEFSDTNRCENTEHKLRIDEVGHHVLINGLVSFSDFHWSNSEI